MGSCVWNRLQGRDFPRRVWCPWPVGYCHGTRSPWLITCLRLVSICCSLTLLVQPTSSSTNDDFSPELPCIYEDHLETSNNWFGFLVNISMLTTGRMSFHFYYPIEKCCQNVLFYNDEQLASLSPLMDCWQKEYLLMSPQNDQILRLTPTFTWSGCHRVYPNGVPYYECVGGRSFTSTGSQIKTWYIAVSNCQTLRGLDLKYQIKVYGHRGICLPGYHTITTTPSPEPDQEHQVEGDATSRAPVANPKTCTIEGNLNTSVQWYGFIANLSLAAGGGFTFNFTFPFDMSKQNIILYTAEDIDKLHEDFTCFKKEALISSRNIPKQVIELEYQASWNGCVDIHTSEGRNITCRGERRFSTPRKIYIAVSSCWGDSGLSLHYRLDVTGYHASTCSGTGSTTPRTPGTIVLFCPSVWISITVIIVQFMLRENGCWPCVAFLRS